QKLHGFITVDKARYGELGISPLTLKANRAGTVTDFEAGPGLIPVIIYLRVSSRDQRDTSKSLEDQLTETLEALAKRGDCVVVGVFWDDDSGTHYDRPGFRAAQDFARTHATHGLVVWHINRYGRDSVDGQIEGREFSRNGCPVWYKRSGGTRFRIANHLEVEDFKDFANDLYDAEIDYREHQTKTRRGQRGILLRGGWPYGQFPHSVLYTVREEGSRGDRLNRVVPRPDASHVLASILVFLEDRAALKALAETLDTTPGILLRDLRSRRLMGVLDSLNLELDDNLHLDLQILTRADYQSLQARLDQLPTRTRRPRRSPLADVLDSTSPAELYEVSRGRMGIVCKCGKLAAPLEGFEYADRDVWQCPDGHKNRVLPDAVLRGLAFDQKSDCPTCGRHEFWQDLGQESLLDKLWRRLKCTKCGTEFLCTHEVEAVRKRLLGIRNRSKPDPTRVAPDPPRLLPAKPDPAPESTRAATSASSPSQPKPAATSPLLSPSRKPFELPGKHDVRGRYRPSFRVPGLPG
ncbi:MAG: recombinase family protein, partial [Halobacteriales archaeon]|nr:recombinase family protein [Halobacteriales archaeon]